MSGIHRLETSSPEIARIIENFERHTGHDFDAKRKTTSHSYWGDGC